LGGKSIKEQQQTALRWHYHAGRRVVTIPGIPSAPAVVIRWSGGQVLGRPSMSA